MSRQFLLRYKGIAAGIGITIFAIAYLIGTLFIRRTTFVTIGAEFMPQIYGYILLFLGACQIYQGIKESKRFVEDTQKPKERKDIKNVLVTFVVIIAYVAIMNFIGFMIASAMLLFLMTILLKPANSKLNYVVTIIFSVVLSIGTYLLFHNVMYLSLPG